MKWYWWALIALAVILTVIVIAAAVNSGKKKSQKTEAEVISSNPDALATSKSMIYQSLSRIDANVSGKPEYRPCYCSDPNVKCPDQVGQNQCYDCCKSKGSTMLSWGGGTVQGCTTCGK